MGLVNIEFSEEMNNKYGKVDMNNLSLEMKVIPPKDSTEKHVANIKSLNKNLLWKPLDLKGKHLVLWLNFTQPFDISAMHEKD